MSLFVVIILHEQVWDVSRGTDEGLIGGATILLFNSKKQLKTGKQKLRLWAGKEADGTSPTSTPGKVYNEQLSVILDVIIQFILVFFVIIFNPSKYTVVCSH